MRPDQPQQDGQCDQVDHHRYACQADEAPARQQHQGPQTHLQHGGYGGDQGRVLHPLEGIEERGQGGGEVTGDEGHSQQQQGQDSVPRQSKGLPPHQDEAC